MSFRFLARHPHLLATTAIAIGLMVAPLGLDVSADGGLSLFQKAAAAQGAGNGQGKRGSGGSQFKGQGGGGGFSTLEERIFRGKGQRGTLEDEAEGDEDSDRPAWAQGNRELNPHAKGGGQPAGAGSKKGDLYGDLYVILRNDNGEPILDENGNVQPILADGTVIQLTPEGDLPEEYADQVVEVDFGRMSVGRAPIQVSQHALDEALAKLADATTVTVDEAGRLVVDGVAIDSPLENLSLYTYLMAGGTIENLPANFDVASLLGAASDKTGKITVDQLVYLNTILGINTVDVASGTTVYYDFSTYDYSRADAYSGITVTYLVDPEGDGTYTTVTESLMDAVFDGQDWTDPTVGGADDFTQSADDSRAVIEFLHNVPTPVPTN